MNQERETGQWTRRQVLAASVATGVATAGAVAAAVDGEAATPANHRKLPVVFLPHGGGPWPFVKMNMGAPQELQAMANYLKSVPHAAKAPIQAILVISAHWEEARPTVMTHPSPPLLFDYYGFPPESYQLTWPAPGEPQLAQKVRQLLESAGFATASNAERGFDHGTFVPLKLAWPDAKVPVVQLSLKRGLDPAEHIAMGAALQPLRSQGVFIIGSGMTYHNMRGFGDPRAVPASEQFDRWLQSAATAEPAERTRLLTQWQQAPAARAVHPREEHLLPLMVIAGAAGADRATVPYAGTLMGLKLSAYHFG